MARAQFHGFDYGAAVRATPGERLAVLPGAIEHILIKDQKEDVQGAKRSALSCGVSMTLGLGSA